jgi:hypothetical protein
VQNSVKVKLKNSVAVGVCEPKPPSYGNIDQVPAAGNHGEGMVLCENA